MVPAALMSPALAGRFFTNSATWEVPLHTISTYGVTWLLPCLRKSVLSIHWKDWCSRWNSNPLATWCEELTHLKSLWCWERLKAGGEGVNRRWVGWLASPTRWTWIWASSGSWWWTGRPGVLQSMGLQRVGQDWATKLNWMKDENIWGLLSKCDLSFNKRVID